MTGLGKCRWARCSPVLASLLAPALAPVLAGWALAILLLHLPGWGGAPRILAAGPEGQSAGADLRYRRIFVPAETPESWPVGDNRYLPMDAEDFASRQEHALTARLQPEQAHIRLQEMILRGQLYDDLQLVGTAELDVVLPATSPRLLSLEPLSLAITSAHWNDTASSPAKLGVWGLRNGTSPQLGVSVDHSGRLTLDWQAVCQRKDRAKIEYAMRTPPAVRKRLELSLPAEAVLEVTPGAVTGNETDRHGRQIWHVELGAATEHLLRIQRTYPRAGLGTSSGQKNQNDQTVLGRAENLPAQQSGPIAQQSRLPRVRQTTVYRIAPEGLDLETTIQLTGRPIDSGKLQLRTIGPADVISATVDRAAVDWQVQDVGNARFVELPLSEGARIVRVRSLAPLVIDRPWQLPTVRPLDLFWTEGTIHLRIDPRLQLQSLKPAECMVRQVLPDLAAGNAAMNYSLLESSDQASLQVVLGNRQPRLRIRTATVSSRRDKATFGRTVAVVQSDGSSKFFVEAEISDNWSILSTETEPADALEEWHVYRDGERQVVRVQLAHSLQADRPLRIELNGRRATEIAAPTATVENLRMLRFRDAVVERELLLVESELPQQLVQEKQISVAQIAAGAVTPEDAELLPEQWQGVLLDVNQLRPNRALKFTPRRAAFVGNVHVELVVGRDTYEHRYGIECKPTSGEVSDLLLQFSQPIPQSTTWTLHGWDGSVAIQPVWNRLDADGSARENRWRLSLPVAMDKPFWLEAQYEIARDDQGTSVQVSPNVVFLPEASALQVWAVLRSGEQGLTVDSRGCTAVAFPASGASATPADAFHGRKQNSALPILGCFRIDQTASTTTDSIPRLVSTKVSAGEEPIRLFARHVNFSTQYTEGGTAINVAEYHLTNRGATRAEFALPNGLALQSVWLGESLLPPSAIGGTDGVFSISLDAQEPRSTITLRYVTQQSPLGAAARIEPVYPKVSFPVMGGRWNLWVSRRYEFADSPHGQRSGWRERLFGPLARSDRQSFFNPFRTRDWHRLWAEPVGKLHAGRLAEGVPWGTNIPVDHRPAIGGSAADVSQSTGLTDLSLPGWRAYRIGFVDRPTAVELVRVDSAQAKWLAIWLLATVVGVWQLAKRPSFLAIVIAGAAAACLLVEPGSVAMPQAIFLGLLTSIVVKSVFRAGDSTGKVNLSPPATAAMLAFAALCLLSNRCQAGPAVGTASEEPSQPQIAAHAMHRVLVPVDRLGQHVGKEVYIPAELYNALHDNRQESQRLGEWVLTNVRLRGSIVEDLEHRRYQCGKWTLVVDVASLRPHCKLTLPLVREDADWLADEHRLDGAPISIDWLSEGRDRGCEVVLPHVGKHRLEIAFRPRVSYQPRYCSVRLAVPPFAAASLDLTLPEKLTGLTIAAAVGVEHGSESGHGTKSGRFHAVLQPTDVLEVRWTPARQTVDAQATRQAEQLAWLHIEPSQTYVDIQLRISAGSGRIPPLRLETDPQLELLPLDSSSPIADLETFAGNPRILQLKISPDIRAPVTIPLRFRLDRTTPIGQIAFPHVRLANVATRQRSLAVSVAAGFSYQERRGDGLNVQSPTEFAARWGASDVEPLFAYAYASNQPTWALNVKPDPQSFTVNQTLRLQCGLEDTAVEYHANIDNVSGTFFVHRLMVPPELFVEEITIHGLADGKPIPSQWAQPTARDISVFLSQPMRGPHGLTLLGRLRHSANASSVVPRIAMKQAGSSTTELELSRDSSALVHWDWPEIKKQENQSPNSLNGDDSVAIGKFTLPSHERQPLDLKITANRSRFAASSLTMLVEQDEAWSAQFLVQVRALEGVVDRIRIAAPAAWKEPKLANSAARLRQAKQPSAKNKLAYEILLDEPLEKGEEIVLQIVGPLDLDADRLVRMPDLQIVDAAQSARYIRLPTMSQGEPMEWLRRGLRLENLPPALQAAVPTSKPSQTYLVEHNHFLAEQRVFSPAMRCAAVRLAEIRGALSTEGKWSATAELILQPGKATNCLLELPPHSQLLQLSVEDQTIAPHRTASGRWHVPLGPPFMPRMITAVYSSQLDLQSGTALLSVPKIVIGDRTLPVPVSLWQLDTDETIELGRIELDHIEVGHAAGNRRIGEASFVRLGFEHRLKAMEEASALAFQLPAWEARQWFLPWQRRLHQANARWQLAKKARPGDNPRDADSQAGWPEAALPDTASTATWQALAEAFAPHLEAAERTAQAMPERHTPSTWTPSTWTPRPASGENRRFATGSDGKLSIQQAATWKSHIGRCLQAAILLAFGMVACIAILRKPGWLRELSRWPQGTALAAGLAWWVWLAPSGLGLLVVTLSLLAFAKHTWTACRIAAGDGNSIAEKTRSLLRPAGQ